MLCRLSDVCELIAGYAFKSKDFGNYSNKVIKITNINPPFVDIFNATGVDVSKYNINKLDKFIAREGDYVLAMTGATIGKIGRITNGLAYINQRVLLFKPTDRVNKEFLYGILTQKKFEQYINNHIDSDSAQPNISAGTIGKYEFNLPTLEIQKRIGSILSRIESKIVINNQINKNLVA